MNRENIKNYSGFTLIELLVVLGVIGIITAIAIPNYLGFQHRAKKRVLKELASSSRADLLNWMQASVSNQAGVVDVNGDGFVGVNEIHTNLATVPNSWIQAFNAKVRGPALSPWNRNKTLFTVAPPAPPNTGQITFSLTNNNRTIKILALDIYGENVFSDTVSIE